jgi:hypothetical protein
LKQGFQPLPDYEFYLKLTPMGIALLSIPKKKTGGRMMQNLDIDRTIAAWSSLAKTVFVPHTEQERNMSV